jgi:hypothetical protein
MEEFPPNSAKSRKPEPEDKKVERVTSGEATRRKKSLGKQFHNTFFGGDFRSAANSMVFGVLIPAAKDALAEAGSQGIEKLIFGDARRRGGFRGAASNLGYVSYNRLSAQSPASQTLRPAISQRARARHDFDEIVLDSRQEADEVLERLFDLLGRYDAASVSDLYELTGIKSTHVDQKWGWTSLKGAGVSKIRGGYLLDLPEPEPLD